jgi:hypothetical protein
LGELGHRLGPGQKARLKTLGIQASQHPPEGIVGRNPMRQGEEGLEPCTFALTKELHVLEPFPAGQEGTQGNDQEIEQMMLLCPLNTWVF